MKKRTLTFLIGAAALFFNQTVKAQTAQSRQADSLKQVRVNWLSKELTVNPEKARQVSAIMDQYKASVNAAIADKSQSEETLRIKIGQLIDEKNSQLKQILTEEQSNRIIPTTERGGSVTPAASRP